MKSLLWFCNRSVACTKYRQVLFYVNVRLCLTQNCRVYFMATLKMFTTLKREKWLNLIFIYYIFIRSLKNYKISLSNYHVLRGVVFCLMIRSDRISWDYFILFYSIPFFHGSTVWLDLDLPQFYPHRGRTICQFLNI